MSLHQNHQNKPFVEYIPAELRENAEWRIIFYAFNPFTEKLEIKRVRVKRLKSITERRKFAKKLVLTINKRLENGWNPFLETKKNKQFTLLEKAAATFLNEIEIEYKDKNLSLDTRKTYNSRIKNLLTYLEIKDIKNFYCYQLDQDFVNLFLDHLRYQKKLSSRTRDNYFTFLFTFCNWLLKKKYIISNPCIGVKKIHKKKNEKAVLSTKIRDDIFEYYKATNPNFLTFCLCCYYCLVRRTELTKLKVSDVNLKKNTLYVKAEDSKNNKSAHVTIPNELKVHLKKHIEKANPNHYLFSDNNYSPGTKRFLPNKATSNWQRMRIKLNIPKTIKWYHLKDTGIVDLIVAGVPLNSVRDQARHHSISQTNDYIPKNMKTADNNILKANLKF